MYSAICLKEYPIPQLASFQKKWGILFENRLKLEFYGIPKQNYKCIRPIQEHPETSPVYTRKNHWKR